MDKRLDDDGRTKLLEQLKIIGRNPATASPIFRANSIRTLLEYGFDHGINAASREAMRCLANAMLLSEGCRQTVIDLGYSGRIAERMKNNNRDDEFLTARILFFATYSGKLDVRELIDKHSLTTSLHQILDRAILRLKSSAQDSNPITTLAHQETLKLLPNLVYYSPDTAFDLAPLLAPLATLLLKVPLPSPALQPPITHLINAILNLNPPPSRIEDPSIREPLYPPSAPSSLATHLIAILSSSLPSSGVSTKESHILLSPLLSLIRALHASAPSPDVITTIRAALLPSDKARAQPLGQGADLPARILRAAVAPPGAIASSGGTARDVLAALLYELSDEDAGTLTRNIGYGHAVGILQRLGKDIAPPQDTGADGSSGSSSSKGIGKEFINPVTGQRIDAEPRAELPEMTDEEKEREAERLFVLFERLRATGVVDIMNPVGQAAREGRLG